MEYKLRYSQYSERSILIEWPAIIDDFMLKDILNFKNKIQLNYSKLIVEIITGYNSLLIIYDFTIDNVNDRFVDLKQLYIGLVETNYLESLTFKIPVCYDAEFGVDLEKYSREKKLSKLEIIKRHTAPVYTVFFIGFLPGFLYLGGLDSSLYLNRKETPNLNVKKGSVAIGGEQTGIYPQDSPGGWHIIGNSPIELFNPKQKPPCYIKAGDKVKFHAVSKSKYVEIQNEIAHSRFDAKTLLIND